jgi:hypothetical protein
MWAERGARIWIVVGNHNRCGFNFPEARPRGMTLLGVGRDSLILAVRATLKLKDDGADPMERSLRGCARTEKWLEK